MSWNVVLFWNTVIILGLTLVRQLRGPSRAWDWIGVDAAILGLTVAGWRWFPGWAGVVGAALTALLVILPLQLRNRIHELIQAGRWPDAIRLADIVRVLHPLGLAAREPALLRAYAATAGSTPGFSLPPRPVDLPFRSSRATVATWTLLGLNVLMFGVEMSSGVDLAPNSDAAYYRLGAVITTDFGWSDIWHLLAANFLHYGTAHLAFNMLALVVLGRFVERYCGVWRYLVIYLVAGVGAMGGVVVIAELARKPNELLIGASGAIMGLVGAQGAIFWREYRVHRTRVAAEQLRPVLTMVVMQVIFDQLVPQVSGTAHLVGLAVGFVVTTLVLVFWPPTVAAN